MKSVHKNTNITCYISIVHIGMAMVVLLIVCSYKEISNITFSF